MNVYDFDKTILSEDSTTHFMWYLLRRQPSLIRHLPRSLVALWQYRFGALDKTAAKQKLFLAFADVKDIDGKVEQYWEKEKFRITRRYLLERQATDVVISASPRFLIENICKTLGVQTVIASEVDKHTGLYTGINCCGEEKVRRFRECFPDAQVDRFYSDSLSDSPMAALAKEAYLVKGEAVFPWPNK